MVNPSILVSPEGCGVIVPIGRTPERFGGVPLGFTKAQSARRDRQFATAFRHAGIPRREHIAVRTLGNCWDMIMRRKKRSV